MLSVNLLGMKKIVLIISILTVLLFSACSSNKVRKTMPISQKMELANNYYERGRYNRAADLYLDIVFERSTTHTPEAQFRLAESYFNLRRYNEAVFEYRELIRMFPDYKDINIAYFRIGEAYASLSLDPHYCQRETFASLDAFEVFLDRFPFDEKREQAVTYVQKGQYSILEKKYYNGYIYYKLYDYSAALMYFDEIIKLENRNDVDRMSRYYSALIYAAREDKEKTKEMLNSLLKYYPQSNQSRRIERLFVRNFR